MNNNDTGARFISTYGLDFYRVAVAMLLTLPGLPCLYTGDEVGAEYLPYEQLSPIDWTDQYGLRDYFAKLIALRRRYPSLQSRAWMPLTADPSVPLFAYVRETEIGNDPILVVLNFSRDEVDATIEIPMTYPGLVDGGAVTDLMSNDRLTVARSAFKVSMPAWGVRVLVGGA